MKLLELPSFFNIFCDCGDWFIDPSWVLFAFRRPCWAECYHGRVFPTFFRVGVRPVRRGIPFSSNLRFVFVRDSVIYEDLFRSMYCSPLFLKCSFV